ncbi:thioredoxin 2 [Brachybacterium muris]|nr:thioredoxin 2 [Brachybacterium muris]
MSAIVTCPNCGKKNRVPAAASGYPRCGVKSAVPWIVDAGDADFAEVVEKAR